MIYDDIYSAINGDATVSSLAGEVTRVKFRQQPKFPAIRFQKISSIPTPSLKQERTNGYIRVVIDVIDHSQSKCYQVADAVKDAMVNADFQNVLDNESDAFESETKLYMVTMDYLIFTCI